MKLIKLSIFNYYCLFFCLAFALNPIAKAQLFVADANGSVGEYDPDTGVTIKSNFITGLTSVSALAVSGNILYVGYDNGNGGAVGEYNATTGQVINSTFALGFTSTDLKLAIANNFLYVADGKVEMYNATTGVKIKDSLSSDITNANSLAISSRNNLLVLNNNSVVSEYDTTGVKLSSTTTGFSPGLFYGPGDVLTASGGYLFVGDSTGYNLHKYGEGFGRPVDTFSFSGSYTNLDTIFPDALAVSGNNLFVVDGVNGKIGKYDATTGAPIKETFISGLNIPTAIVVNSVPEPTAWIMVFIGLSYVVAARLSRIVVR